MQYLNKPRLVLKLLALIGLILGTGVILDKFFCFNQSKLSVDKPQQLNQNIPISKDIKLYQRISDVVDVPQGTFNYGGSICFAALSREGFNQAISNVHPEFELNYVEPKTSPGCNGGLEMLLDKELGLSFAQNSRPLTETEREFVLNQGGEVESIPVAIDGIVFYVNKSLGIKSLSLQQLQDIYLGRLKNWQEIDDHLPDISITPISLAPETNQVLSLLMGRQISPSLLATRVEIVRDYTTAIRKVALAPSAISYASAAILKGQSSIQPLALLKSKRTVPVSGLLSNGTVNLPAFQRNIYPLTRGLFVLILRDGTKDEKAGVAYANFLISAEGQKIIRKAGFVPIYWATQE